MQSDPEVAPRLGRCNSRPDQGLHQQVSSYTSDATDYVSDAAVLTESVVLIALSHADQLSSSTHQALLCLGDTQQFRPFPMAKTQLTAVGSEDMLCQGRLFYAITAVCIYQEMALIVALQLSTVHHLQDTCSVLQNTNFMPVLNGVRADLLMIMAELVLPIPGGPLIRMAFLDMSLDLPPPRPFTGAGS